MDSQAVKIFSYGRVGRGNYALGEGRRVSCVWSTGMTIFPRDSDIIGAAALLAIVLVTGLVRVLGL